MTEVQFAASMARGVADKLMAEIRSLCDRIEVAGSLRRNKPHVHDIDIVLVPLHATQLNERLNELVERGSLTRVRDGESIKTFIATKTGIPVDLYIAAPETFPTLLLIRTGSKEHNIKLATRARGLGMKLHASGDGIEDVRGNLLRVGTEEEVFSLLELPYVRPEERD